MSFFDKIEDVTIVDIKSQWEMANFGPIQNPNPLTDCKKIVTVDYARETNPCANLDGNPSTGASRQMGEI